jgi:hypothetical protein
MSAAEEEVPKVAEPEADAPEKEPAAPKPEEKEEEAAEPAVAEVKKDEEEPAAAAEAEAEEAAAVEEAVAGEHKHCTGTSEGLCVLTSGKLPPARRAVRRARARCVRCPAARRAPDAAAATACVAARPVALHQQRALISAPFCMRCRRGQAGCREGAGGGAGEGCREGG